MIDILILTSIVTLFVGGCWLIIREVERAPGDDD